jgi:hypothetical protein
MMNILSWRVRVSLVKVGVGGGGEGMAGAGDRAKRGSCRENVCEYSWKDYKSIVKFA